MDDSGDATPGAEATAGPDTDPTETASTFPVRGAAPGGARLRRFEPGDTDAVVTLHDRGASRRDSTENGSGHTRSGCSRSGHTRSGCSLA